MNDLIKALREPQVNVHHAEKLCREAADVLESRDWIPTVERLPDTDDKVLCCTRTKTGTHNIIIGYYAGRWCCGMNSNVVAWMPLPEPYEVTDHE